MMEFDKAMDIATYVECLIEENERRAEEERRKREEFTVKIWEEWSKGGQQVARYKAKPMASVNFSKKK